MKTLITRNAEHSILKYIMVGLILGCLYMLFVHFVSAPAFALLYALPVGIVAGLVPFVCKEFSNHAEKSALDEMVQDGIDVDNLPEEAILGLEGRIFCQ